MPRFRILQIVINSLLFLLLAFSGVDFAADTYWRFDSGDVRPLAVLFICIAFMIALVGSIRLNLQILRNSNLHDPPARSLSGQLSALAFAMAFLYIAVEWRTFANLTYDSHLSTHYLAIALPDWSWLQLSRLDGAVTIQNDQILNLLVYLVVISLLVMTSNISVHINGANVSVNEVNPSLIKYQIASGIIFLFLAGVCLYALIGRLTAFRALLEFDPALMNLSNLSGFGFRVLNFLLLILYGQWILRDGLRLHMH